MKDNLKYVPNITEEYIDDQIDYDNMHWGPHPHGRHGPWGPPPGPPPPGPPGFPVDHIRNQRSPRPNKKDNSRSPNPKHRDHSRSPPPGQMHPGQNNKGKLSPSPTKNNLQEDISPTTDDGY